MDVRYVDHERRAKRRNLTIEEMTGGDRRLYRELRNFRAGIEAGISTSRQGTDALMPQKVHTARQNCSGFSTDQ